MKPLRGWWRLTSFSLSEANWKVDCAYWANLGMIWFPRFSLVRLKAEEWLARQGVFLVIARSQTNKCHQEVWKSWNTTEKYAACSFFFCCYLSCWVRRGGLLLAGVRAVFFRLRGWGVVSVFAQAVCTPLVCCSWLLGAGSLCLRWSWSVCCVRTLYYRIRWSLILFIWGHPLHLLSLGQFIPASAFHFPIFHHPFIVLSLSPLSLPIPTESRGT